MACVKWYDEILEKIREQRGYFLVFTENNATHVYVFSKMPGTEDGWHGSHWVNGFEDRSYRIFGRYGGPATFEAWMLVQQRTRSLWRVRWFETRADARNAALNMVGTPAT